MTGKWLAAVVSAILMGVAAPSLAAEDGGEARKLELSRRLFIGMNMDQMMGDMMRSMEPAMIEQMRRAHPQVTAEQAEAISEAVTEVMEGMMPKIVDQMIPAYAATFSEQELADTVAFYESASGRALIAKTPELMKRMTPLMMELGPAMEEELRKNLCSKIDCGKLASKPRES